MRRSAAPTASRYGVRTPSRASASASRSADGTARSSAASGVTRIRDVGNTEHAMRLVARELRDRDEQRRALRGEAIASAPAEVLEQLPPAWIGQHERRDILDRRDHDAASRRGERHVPRIPEQIGAAAVEAPARMEADAVERRAERRQSRRDLLLVAPCAARGARAGASDAAAAAGAGGPTPRGRSRAAPAPAATPRRRRRAVRSCGDQLRELALVERRAALVAPLARRAKQPLHVRGAEARVAARGRTPRGPRPARTRSSPSALGASSTFFTFRS